MPESASLNRGCLALCFRVGGLLIALATSAVLGRLTGLAGLVVLSFTSFIGSWTRHGLFLYVGDGRNLLQREQGTA